MSVDPPPQRLADWLNDMLEAIRLARRYVEAIDKVQFLSDRKTQQAVILNLPVLAEVHWCEATGVGKKEFKIKRFIEGF